MSKDVKLREIYALNEITHRILFDDLDVVFRETVKFIMKRSKAESCSVMLLSKDGKNLIMKYIMRAKERKDKKVLKLPVSNSAAGHVIKTRAPVLIRQKTKDSKFVNFGTSSYSKGSYLGIPLIYKDEILGVINLDFLKDARKDYFLIEIADKIALAVYNSNLHYEYRRKVDRLTALYDIVETMNATLDLDKVLDLIVVKIVKLVNSKMCSVMLLNENKTKLVPKTFYSSDPSFLVKDSIEVRSSIAGLALKHKKIMHFTENSKNKFQRKQVNSLGIKSMLCVPLLLENHAIGTINVYSKDIRNYTPGEIELLDTLADQAAIAIEKAILYKKIERDRDNLKKILSISQSVNSSLDLDSVMRLFLQKTMEFTNAKKGAILMLYKDCLKIKYHKGYREGTVSKVCLKLGSGITGWVALHKKPLIIPDVSIDPRYINISGEVKSEAALPIILRDRVIGVLNLDSTKTNNFGRYHDALEILLNAMAIAIENARLHTKQRNFNIKLKEEVKKATKNLVEANKRLRKIDEVKSEFVSNVSHELRTPLTSIKGYAKLMYVERVGKINNEQKECLKIINDESDRLIRLINDILDISKLESRKVKLNIELTDINSLIEEVLSIMYMQANEKKIDIFYDVKQGMSLKLDKDKVKQILNNLISNAVKFTPPQGKIKITVEDLGQEIKFSVIDTGKGIPKEKLHMLFDKFSQIDPVLTKTASGTGLGLVIAKHLVELHHGRIWVSSSLGKGSTFSFTIHKHLI